MAKLDRLSRDVHFISGLMSRRIPFIEVIYADGGYRGPKMAATAAKTGAWRLEIVKRNDVPRFEVLPNRRTRHCLNQPQQAPRP